MAAARVTLLFSDLANTAELVQRGGDLRTQGRFQAHHRLLQRFVAAHAGQEPRWLGDGFVSVFPVAADAARCAAALQLAESRRAVSGRLGLRVGLHAGDAPRQETDYFATPMLTARQLCHVAQPGQVLCSAEVAALLADTVAFTVREWDPSAPDAFDGQLCPYEIFSRRDQPLASLTHTPFVGRTAELQRLSALLNDACTGSGGLVLLAGEPGIGKTRMLEEFAEIARIDGALVWSGRCYEGEAARPYGPFVEALAECARTAAPDALRADLGGGAAPLARLVPAIREWLPGIPEPIALQPDEERVRLLDALAQMLIAVAARAPLVLLLDDLHWADPASVAVLRHVAGFAVHHRLLLVGAYRDVEVTSQQPLADALGALPRETTYTHLALCGFGNTEVEELLEAVAEREVPAAFVAAITAETNGNPFFIREVLLHLVEEGKVVWQEGQWTSRLPVAELGIPHGVRQVIQRRLARLSETANRLLCAAAGFTGSFQFAVAAQVAELDEADALRGIDEALTAQLIVAAGGTETFDFTHALVRHTLYAALSPPRQVRLHRRIAEAMEQVYGDRSGSHAGEVARHYHCSAGLPGAERGVTYSILAADYAEQSAAFAEAAEYLRMALDLADSNDSRRPRLLARRALALTWSSTLEQAETAATQAAAAIATAEGNDAAADFLADAADTMWTVAAAPRAWSLATHGLRYLGQRRDTTWARLMVHEIQRREFSDPQFPGILRNFPEEREVTARLWELPALRHVMQQAFAYLGFSSRADVLARAATDPLALFAWAGEYRRALPLLEQATASALGRGQIVVAAYDLMLTARIHAGAGNWASSRLAYAQAQDLYERAGKPPFLHLHLATVGGVYVSVSGEGWERSYTANLAMLQTGAIEIRWAAAAMQAWAALAAATLGWTDDALRWLGATLPAVELAPGSAASYPQVLACLAATLEECGRTDHIETLERHLRQKWLEPDFRYEMCDARHSLAMLCGLQGRFEEAADWFAKARGVLEEQGAAPLRALTDFREARMYQRRGDRERAETLLHAALEQFGPLSMTGWTRRAETMMQSLEVTGDKTPGHNREAASLATDAIFRREGEYWTLAYGGTTGRVKDIKGLHYLAHLLRNPSWEFHVLDLVRADENGSARFMDGVDGAGPLLDTQAKAEYRNRLSELRAELCESEQFNDTGRSERLRAEIESISQQLSAAVGLGGRDRAAASATERARATVTQRIKTAIKRIAAHSPALADHLASRVRTGRLCVYRPDPARRIEWTLDP